MSESPLAGFDARAVIARLRELHALTGTPDGAGRECWTLGWRDASAWLTRLLEDAGARVERDEAGNLWARSGPAGGPALTTGSHIDSVANGGWLDGALGSLAAAEAIAAHRRSGHPSALQLVNWADEEGARFGRSLFGSGAVCGTVDPDDVRELADRRGRSLPDVLAENDVALDALPAARGRLETIDRYVELHIEQGPVLEAEGAQVGVVTGTFGVRRRRLRFGGRPAHSGSTPLRLRHDAFLAAAQLAVAARADARELGAVSTVGEVTVAPGVQTIVNGACTITVDQRALEADTLDELDARLLRRAHAFAQEHGAEVAVESLLTVAPQPFDPALVATAHAVLAARGARSVALPSGALHDATEVAAHRPTAMLFAPSIGGVSHAPDEDTHEDDLVAALDAYADLLGTLLTQPGAAGGDA